MEKVIKLIMQSDKSIDIQINGQSKHTISAEKRELNAEILFNILEFNIGDTYTLEKENPDNIDEKVLEFFYDLINEISTKINNIQIGENDDGTV